MVGKGERGRARAAFAAVDREKINPLAGARHFLGEFLVEIGLANRGLDANGQSRGLGDLFHKIDELMHGSKFLMTIGTDAIDSFFDPANGGDLSGDLLAREHTALARFGALGKFNLNGADLGDVLTKLYQAFDGKSPVGIAAAKFSSPDLIHDVGPLPVIGRGPALAGVVITFCGQRPLVEGRDGRGAERAKTHPGDIDDGGRAIRFPAFVKFPKDLGAGGFLFFVMLGTGESGLTVGDCGILDDRISHAVDLVVGAKTKVVILPIGRTLDPLPLRTIERGLFAIAGNQVLADLGSDFDEEVT